ncbi:MAG: CPBP family intramembrane glutamic endopeptidase [Candidatus Thermoplasmatota archaeon]
MLLFQLIFVFFIMLLGVPLLWYSIVNKCSIKDTFLRLRLKRENLRISLLWGFIGFLAAFFIVLIINIILMYYGISDNLSNISVLEEFFSPVSLYIIVTIQPIGEEVFFRGFLLDKISFLSGEKSAVISTSILFGLSHLSYNQSYYIAFYTMFISMIFGFILGLIVIKTKNLYASISSHILINAVSLTIYLIDKSYSF